MLSQLQKYGAPDMLVPIRTDSAEQSCEKIAALHERFGFTRFCLDGLSKGYRAEGYPSREEYEREAKIFRSVKEHFSGKGLSFGWFCNLTVKSGGGFSPIVRANGTAHPFANCPMDERFAETLAADMAAYAEIARPDFIFVEDDFSLGAADGCFCERHLAAFAEKEGREYTRKELAALLSTDTPEALRIHRAWQALKRETLVSLARKIRAAMDRRCPEIPIGLMQSGAADRDGDFTAEVARALAGEGHAPFVRLYGTFYCGFESKKLPKVMHHPLYFVQHMPTDILRYHESDTYPHTRFFTSGKQLGALLAAAYSYGMVGSILFAQQYFDKPFEEDAFGELCRAEGKRLSALCALARECRPVGVQICYDPFFNMLSDVPEPFFAECLGRFGIPFATEEASVAFLDARQAKYMEHGELMRYLSRGLILDGEAARLLCERGYGEYLGVSVGAEVLEERPSLLYDLGACEVIREEFAEKGKGREMWSAYGYCPKGNGKWMSLSVDHPATRTVTEAVDFRGKHIMPAMTYFENALGGKVAVMSLTVRDNPSQALYNYRRQGLLQRLIRKMADEYPFVQNAPEIYLIALQPKKKEGALLGALTVINLGEDDAAGLRIYLPPKLRGASRFLAIGEDGCEVELSYEKEKSGIRLCKPLRHLDPLYIVIKK